MWRRLLRLVRPDLPEPVEPAVLLRLLRLALIADLVVASGNVATRFGLGVDADPAVYDVFLAWNVPAHAVVIACLVSALRSDGDLDRIRGRVALAVIAAAWTIAPGTWMVGGPAGTLNLAFGAMLVGTVRLVMDARLGLVALGAVVATDVAFAALRIAGALPDRSPFRDLELLTEPDVAALFVGWRAVVVAGVFGFAGYAANRYRESEHRLRRLNAELEDRVAAQVAALDRAGRLRRYLAPQLVDELLAADEDPAAHRDRRPVTVMFADLRGFTGLVERTDPDTLATVLNRYFEEVTRIAFSHGGTVDKFIGDAVMVVFGAPRATGEADQARRCVAMALAIQARVGELQGELAALGAPLEVRVGIASGVATVGAFGAAHRADYTVVGAPVNRAARLESLAPPGRVLVDDPTRALLDDAHAVTPFGEVTLKGFARPEPAWLVGPPRGSGSPPP